MALWRSWTAGPPPRWFRIMSLVTAVLFPLKLIGEHSLDDVMWAVAICAIMLVNAVVPRGLYDGRFSAWMNEHPLVNGGSAFLVLGAGLFSILSDFISSSWPRAAIALPAAAVFAVLMVYRTRTLQTQAQASPAE